MVEMPSIATSRVVVVRTEGKFYFAVVVPFFFGSEVKRMLCDDGLQIGQTRRVRVF